MEKATMILTAATPVLASSPWARPGAVSAWLWRERRVTGTRLTTRLVTTITWAGGGGQGEVTRSLGGVDTDLVVLEPPHAEHHGEAHQQHLAHPIPV